MPKPAHDTRCPRCGYDLSGTVEAWTEWCPIDGICSECGLNFPWHKILNPVFSHIPGFFETRAHWRLRDLWITARRAIRPWRFWSWITLSNPFRFGRAVLATLAAAATMCIVPLLAAITTYAAGITALSVLARRWGSSMSVLSIRGWVNYVPSRYGHYDNAAMLLLYPAIFFVICAMIAPITFTLLGSSLKAAQIRRSHLVRLTVYQLAGLPLVVAPGLAMMFGNWMIDAINSLSSQRFPYVPGHRPTPFIDEDVAIAACYILILILACFWFVGSWASFQGNYLKLRHAARDATILFIMSALLAMPLALIAMTILMDI